MKHFPWQRFTLCIIGLLFLYFTARVQRDWLYYFVILDPGKTASKEGITALMGMGSVLLVCVSTVVVFFITGSTKSLSDMFRFNSSATSAAESIAQSVTSNEHAPKAAHFDDGSIK